MTAPAYSLVQLPNGVNSVRCLDCGETFHPVVGPAAEAELLYVRHLNLLQRRAQCPGELVIWDVGLGAGANALAALRALRHSPGSVRLLSFDRTLEPLRFGLAHADALGYFSPYESDLARLLELGRHSFADAAHRVDWSLHVGDFPSLLHGPDAIGWPKPHAILFDAFSPARNPEMWTLPLFTRLTRLLDPDRPCALATYSRSTLLRVTLLLAGFYVGPGPQVAEKEETTVAANTPALLESLLDRDWLQRARRSTSAEPLPGPPYRQARLRPESWEQLREHPQFR